MNLKRSIVNTLIYSDIFDYPLTPKEIYKYLLSPKQYNFKQVKEKLNVLYETNKIYKKGENYSVGPIKDKQIEKKGNSKDKYKKTIKKVKEDLGFLFKLPFVKFVGVSGSVAAKNISNGSDVDLFIIASNNMVWITRLLLVIYLKLVGNYRDPYCPNVYISNDSLQWEEKNLYLANEIVRLKPLHNKDYTYEKFLNLNKWVLDYLPNFDHCIPNYNLDYNTRFTTKLLFPLNLLFFIPQYIYMKRKITTERIGLNKALFFKNDYSNEVISEYETRVENYH